MLVLNALAAMLTAAGVAALVWLYDAVLARAEPALAPASRAACALLAALAVGVGGVWWQQANGFEVHALQAVLLPVAALLAGDWSIHGTPRRAALAGFGLGFAFTNHGTTIHLLPALLVIVLLGGRLGARARELPAAVAGGVLGLTPLLYLPLRAAQHPRFSWSEPTTWGRFWRHASAAEFRGWMFSDPNVGVHQARAILHVLSSELASVGLALAGFGLWRLLSRDRRVGIAVLAAFTSCVVFASGYGIRDLDAYLLVAVAALGAFLAIGLAGLAASRRPAAAAIVGVPLVAVGFALHRRACDESGLTMVADLARAQLGALPPHALLFSQQWDYTVSPSYYLQAVEGLRTDVVVVSPQMLRNPWYARELARRAPEVVAPVRAPFEAFLAAGHDFEERRRYDAARIGRAWEAFIGALLDSASSRRPVYLTLGTGLPHLAGRVLVPEGLAYRVAPDSSYRPEPLDPWKITPWRGRADAYGPTAAWIIAQARIDRARWELAHGHPERVELLMRDALRFDPRIDPARVPPLPLDGNALVAQSAATFARIRAALAVATEP